jgi:DNA-binding CsgD family transcriptional regulator
MVTENTNVLLKLNVNNITEIVSALKKLDEIGVGYTLIEEAKKTDYELEIHRILKPRELEILGFLSHGASYEDISDKVHISIDGVRYYIKKIYKKLGVTNGRDAVRIFFTQMSNN